MGNFPVAPTFTAGEIATAAKLNALAAVPQWLSNPPRVLSYANNTTNNVANATYVPVSYDTDLFDSDNMHSTTSNPTRIYINTPGLYSITASITWPTVSSGSARGELLIGVNQAGNFTTSPPGGVQSTPFPGTQPMTFLTFLTPLHSGDYFECFAYQASGSTLTISSGGVHAPFVQALWVAQS